MPRPRPIADALRERVLFQRPSTADADADSFGTIDLKQGANWIDVGKRPAGVTTGSAREFATDQQQQADATHTVKVRYDSLTRQAGPTWRLLWIDNGTQRTLNILDAIDKDARRVEIIITCREVRE